MPRPDKAAAVAELTEEFRSSSAAVLTDYRGLTVAQLKALRTALGQTTSYSVVKNTLTRIAARDAGVDGVEELLVGPSAIAFVKGDPVEAARGLRDFAKTNPLLVIKGGIMDGRPLTPADINKLADLEPREVLLAKLAGAMKASLTNAVSLFAAPLAQTARLLEALRQKVELENPVAPAAEVASTPAADEPLVEVAAEGEPEITEAEITNPEAIQALAEETITAAEAAAVSQDPDETPQG